MSARCAELRAALQTAQEEAAAARARAAAADTELPALRERAVRLEARSSDLEAAEKERDALQVRHRPSAALRVCAVTCGVC